MKRIGTLLLTAFCIGCGQSTETEEQNVSYLGSFDLGAYTNCLSSKGVTQIIAHRGGPGPGFPENALPTIARAVRQSAAFVEVDIRTSADGVLFLHHDEELDWSTTGRGMVAETEWSKLRQISLEDPDRQVTAYGPTRLDDLLAWSAGRTVVELDIKPGTDYDDIAAVVRSAGAEKRIILIAYNLNQAFALHRAMPDAMLSVPIRNEDDLNRLRAAGISDDHILAWLGTELPDRKKIAFLEDNGIETIIGTLGGKDSLDRQFLADGDPSEYADLSEMGIDLIATDAPVDAFSALEAADRHADGTVCRASQVFIESKKS